MDSLLVIMTISGLIMAYFLPCLIATTDHPQFNPILVLNIFLGWTLIGWVGCLAWACMNYSKNNNIVRTEK